MISPLLTLFNRTIHEIGHLLATDPPTPFTHKIIPPSTLAHLLHAVHTGTITRPTAKSILGAVFHGDARPINGIIEESAKLSMPVSGYEALAAEVMRENEQAVRDIQQKGKLGKLQFLVGQMMRHRGKGEGVGKVEVQPKLAEDVLKRKLGL